MPKAQNDKKEGFFTIVRNDKKGGRNDKKLIWSFMNDKDMESKMTNSEEFKKLVSYLNKLRSRYFHALSAFFVYKTLEEARAPNVVGDKNARDNISVMSDFVNFFVPSKEALRVYFFLELAKMFDVSNESLHIEKIVNCTQSQINKLTVDSFKEFNQDRDFLEELVKNYKGIKQEDIKEIKEILEKNKGVLQKLKNYRNQYLAHDQIQKEKISISEEEITSLFEVLGKVMNLISSKLNHSSSIWSHVENDCKNDTTLVLNYLKRFEYYRLKEIDKKYETDLQNIKKI